jgi:hypothetical protein
MQLIYEISKKYGNIEVAFWKLQSKQSNCPLHESTAARAKLGALKNRKSSSHFIIGCMELRIHNETQIYF